MGFNLCIAAILKNEDPYLDEWICWHLLQGVEHFFLYDNDSTDRTWEILEKYSRLGIATIEKISGTGQQFNMIDRCLRDHGMKSKWMGMIDCDEFIEAEARLPQFLKSYEDYSALAVHWYLFGSKEVKGMRLGLVIERFAYRQEDVNRHVKSIIQPSKTISRGKDSHSFRLVTPAVNESKLFLPKHYATRGRPSAKRIRIRHYHTKSKEEFIKRKSMPRVSTGTFIRDIEESFKHHDRNEVYDPVREETIKEVKKLMEKFK